ncbi:MAG TPA: MBL fold metallo-hydrolase [Nitrososphaera sp.]|jgi:7,8-dihydropterin-6-yl-methyl-4-(beta-D-ribofuranosyl)aminobenzene 5'-phosphate synthase|nr:MBL fold metallo-hydrolase [Nitrososphaera sp.]
MPLKEVDKVEVTCLVDNNVDVLLPNTEVAHRPFLAKNWYERPLIAEHGFSAAVTVESGGRKHRVLLDSGLDPLVAAHNVDVLDFDLSTCELVISSHGHIDHAGGLLNIRKKMNRRQRIPLVLHEDAFRNRMVKFQDGRTINLPAPSKSFLTKAGYEIILKQSQSLWIDNGILVTGEITRTNNFEKGFPNHYSEVDEDRMENDPFIKDDQAIIMNVKDKGLVVITGCGHAGIINTLNYAKELTGQDKIYAVVGGMHLTGGVFEPIIHRTVDELQTLKPQFVIPCHCSGLKAMNEIARKMPLAFIQNSVGTNYIF